jgi:hypothetical protein
VLTSSVPVPVPVVGVASMITAPVLTSFVPLAGVASITAICSKSASL